jgi:hypothetical protein
VNGKPFVSQFDFLLQQKAEDLVGENCYFGTTPRGSFFTKKVNIYEMRVNDRLDFIECWYQSGDVRDDGNFLREGIVPDK